MSGFVALLRTDGAAVERQMVERLTAALAFRGPDGTRSVVAGPMGLGHALLAANAGAELEMLPARIGDLWINGDVRLDARGELIARLEQRDERPGRWRGAPNAELVVASYRTWGKACTDHLLGDYAFLIWDQPRRTLFCARDPFGVKLLYYAHVGPWLLLGNTLASLRRHPSVSDRLDPAVMASLVLWGENFDRSSTTFADIRCVPAGHALTWTDGGAPRIRRWWELPPEPPLTRYSDRRDYVDHFRALLDRAVADRLPAPRVAVFMSGGLDSTMLAAVARDRLRAAGSACPPLALTIVFDRLLVDRERYYSTLAAFELGLPIHHYPADYIYSSWDWMLATTAPEPGTDLANAPSHLAYARAVRERCRVILTGFDGDALLDARVGALWRARLARGDLGGVARELAWHLRRGQLPRVGVRAALRRFRDRSARFDGYPPWVGPDFERRHGLREQWLAAVTEPSGSSTPRGGTYAALTSPMWRSLLDAMDPGVTGVPIEQRHPLIDLRLVRFALSLPVVPWCINKHLFREAMRDVLPAPILTRPKEPLVGDPITAGLRSTRPPGPREIAAELAEYVQIPRYLEACARLRDAESPSAALAYTAFNTFALNAWLGSAVRHSSSWT